MEGGAGVESNDEGVEGSMLQGLMQRFVWLCGGDYRVTRGILLCKDVNHVDDE